MRELIGDLQNDLQLGDSSTASEVTSSESLSLGVLFTYYLLKFLSLSFVDLSELETYVKIEFYGNNIFYF